jgi:hypothetical protein
MNRTKWMVGTGLAAWMVVLGCGGNGNGVFSTTTTTAGSFDTQRQQGTAGNPGAAAAPGMAGDEILIAELTDEGPAIQLINPASKNISSVAKLPSEQLAYVPSAQGDFVAFIAKKETGLGLFANTTNTLERAIPLGPSGFASFGSIQFAPDGKRVIVAGQLGGDPSSVYAASIDGKVFRKIDEGDDASLSPNGKTIVYSKVVGGKSAIFVRGVDGKGERKLTDGKFDDLIPQWSKDSKRVVFTSNRDGKFGLYAVGAGGGKVTKLLVEDAVVFGGSLSPDGKRMVYSKVSTKPEESGVFMLTLGSGKPMRIHDRPVVTGPLYWTTPSVTPGKNAEQPGPLAMLMSARAKRLLNLPDIKMPKPAVPSPAPDADKKDEKKDDKPKTTGG